MSSSLIVEYLDEVEEGHGDVLRFLSKKNDVWFPKLKPVPVLCQNSAL